MRAVLEVLGGLQRGGVLLRLILRVVGFLLVVGDDTRGVVRLQSTSSQFFWRISQACCLYR